MQADPPDAAAVPANVGTKNGGIDLTPANGILETQNAGEEIKFHLNQAQIA